MGKRTKGTRRKTRPLTAKARAKLRAVRKAAKLSYPTADIRQMLDEIERGYLSCWR